MDYAQLARGAGYAKTFVFDDLEEWTTAIGDVLKEKGPVLIVMKTEPEITDWNNDPPNRKSRHMREAGPATRALLNTQ